MHIARRLTLTLAVGAGALGLIAMPATALATPQRVLMPNCTPKVHPDFAHMSRTPNQVSAHAYWTRGTCTKASVGTVLVYLQEKKNGKWVMEGHEGIAVDMLPGKIKLSLRPNARGTCGSKTKTEWRSVGIVRVNANGDNGNNQSTTKEQDLPCHI
ncbi:MAG TPA: hypothetical protein VFI65_02110 [Streptosporangiaceae bacterium]|nr:hypothetical protein [Streptosporangiaceae bacterium]